MSKANLVKLSSILDRLQKKREGPLNCEQSRTTWYCSSSGPVSGPSLLREWYHEWKDKSGGKEKDQPEGDDLVCAADDDDEDSDAEDQDGRPVRKKVKTVKNQKIVKPVAPVPQQSQQGQIPRSGRPEKRKRGRPRKMPDDTDDSASEPRPSKRIRLEEEVEEEEEDTIVDPQEFMVLKPTCGICFGEFQLVHSPINASNIHKAASSTQLPFGISMPYPLCSGSGSPDAIVFPIQCPECPIETWEEGVSETIAARVLSEEDMVIWHHQQLLDSIPRIYCPNKKCSALIQTPEEPIISQAQCPACDTLICISCRVLWHEDLTCEAYQALPPDERSPEDRKALKLMKEKKWRRCPGCLMIVELSVGCHHITCRCKTQFCFRCGANWDPKWSRCSRVPSCEMWDEDMLYAEEERRREAARIQEPQPVQVPGARRPGIPGGHVWRPRVLDWMSELQSNAIQTQQAFTRNMLSSFHCGYCPAGLRTFGNLRYHLAHVKHHQVYACCHRFFRNENALEDHVRSSSSDHQDQVRY